LSSRWAVDRPHAGSWRWSLTLVGVMTALLS
jgi:hypothetical protein